MHPAAYIAVGWAAGAALALFQFVVIGIVRVWTRRRRGETPLVPLWGPGSWWRLPYGLLLAYVCLLVAWPVVLPATIPVFWARHRLLARLR
ncbi:MAG: hypothetical protein JWO31_2410 [Phycisphaerales bacterium]|nr:hypothetical protein [Phycisphaerales bacterium]